MHANTSNDIPLKTAAPQVSTTTNESSSENSRVEDLLARSTVDIERHLCRWIDAKQTRTTLLLLEVESSEAKNIVRRRYRMLVKACKTATTVHKQLEAKAELPAKLRMLSCRSLLMTKMIITEVKLNEFLKRKRSIPNSDTPGYKTILFKTASVFGEDSEIIRMLSES